MKKYWLIVLIWIFGLFLRCYRQHDLLGFYYDQGRDALIASEIISLKNLPAIGPTTGIAGLFLGPFWFYLITPGYFFGHGSPSIAALFISFLESLTIPLIFILVKKYWQTNTAYLSAIIWAFSHYLIRSSRWFSNPSPLPLFVVLMIYFSLSVVSQKKYHHLPLILLLLGLSLQLEAASAVFFIPVLIIFFLTNQSIIHKIKIKHYFLSALSFLMLLLPQLAFEIKNNFLISQNFLGFLTGRINTDSGRSWGIPSLSFLINRLDVYYQSFMSKLSTELSIVTILLWVTFIIVLGFVILRHHRHQFIRLVSLWLFVPLFLLLFFLGNYGNLYDYYLTGFFPAFVILFSVFVTTIKFRLIIPTFLVFFYLGNATHLKNYLSAGTDGPTHITLGNQLQAVFEACSQNQNQLGNIDYYVPPVIPYAYEYLVSWQQSIGRCSQFDIARNQIVYLIYEVDPPHPERLQNWLAKYSADTLLDHRQFGGVIFEKRQRTPLLDIAQ